MNRAYLLIGGNIGDREAWLAKARESIAAGCAFITAESSIYETAAWGKEDQPAFLNQALEIETDKSPRDLLNCLLSIELAMGRERKEKYGPRTMDIDILLFNQEIVQEKDLVIPHPRMQQRRFVLVPLQEIAPLAVHPAMGQTITQLLTACTDPLTVHKFT